MLCNLGLQLDVMSKCKDWKRVGLEYEKEETVRWGPNRKYSWQLMSGLREEIISIKWRGGGREGLVEPEVGKQ